MSETLESRCADISLQAAQMHELLSKHGVTEEILCAATRLRTAVELVESLMRVELNADDMADDNTSTLVD